MSVIPFPIPRSALSPGTAMGQSQAGQQVLRQLEAIRESLDSTQTLGSAFDRLMPKFLAAKQEASEDNWDGHGGRPADPGSCFHSWLLMQMLPTLFPLPSVGVDPDGEIDFEWYVAPRWTFSVSVGANGELSYAGLFGRNEVHGVEHSTGTLPISILGHINRLYSEAPSATEAVGSAG